MEVLKPQLIWIGKRCYRKNPLKDGKGFNPEDEELDQTDLASDMTYCDEVCDLINLDIEETNKGFRLAFEVPNAYYKFIIGKKGETKKRLEIETHTQIRVPKPGDKQEIIVIDGHDKKGIVSAKTRLDVLIDSARRKQQFTHFLSIPITSDEVVMGFEDFKIEVMTSCDGDRGLDVSLFQNPKKLHLTIGTLVLLSDKEVQKTLTLLDTCQEELIDPILKGQKLDIAVKGLEYMNDDPGEVDVLYAKVEPGDACDRLQILVDRLVDKFTSAGLMQQEHDRVKLHVTVINTLMRKDPTGTSVPRLEKDGRQRGKPRESFDASGVLRKFKDYNFGTQHVTSIHLSQRYSTGEDGYYECAGSLTLPS